MKKSVEKMTGSGARAAVDYVPCVLKLDKGKFASYVEEYVDRVPPLDLAANAVKIFSKRKKAWRAALAMALQRTRRSRAQQSR